MLECSKNYGNFLSGQLHFVFCEGSFIWINAYRKISYKELRHIQYKEAPIAHKLFKVLTLPTRNAEGLFSQIALALSKKLMAHVLPFIELCKRHYKMETTIPYPKNKRWARLAQWEEGTCFSSSFNINALSDSDCLLRFRFKKEDIGKIESLVQWNGQGAAIARTPRRRYLVDPILALCVMLRRLSTPSRWKDIEIEFGKHTSYLDEMFYFTVQKFYGSFSHLIRNINSSLWISRAPLYAAAISEKGLSMSHCIGFIDGTKLQISRPKGRSQRATYSGHKRINCIKFQAISAPDGLILHLFGPVEGGKHDLTMYRESEVDASLASILLIDGE